MRNLKAPKVPQDDVAVPADTPFRGGDYLQRLDKALSQALAPPPKQDARFDHDLNSPANRRARGEHVSPEQEGPLPPACQLIDRVGQVPARGVTADPRHRHDDICSAGDE